MQAVIVVGLLTAAAPDPNAILQRVDAAANRAQDMVMTLEVAVSTRGSDPLERTLKVWQRGAAHRMVKFVAPARLRGTGILKSGDKTTLYTAAYKRVRRIAGKQGGGSFMGTGFSINDLARVRFSADYAAALHKDAATTWQLKLTPTRPGDHRHATLLLTVRKADHLVAGIVTLDASGGVLRSIAAEQFKTVGSYTIAHRITIDEVGSGKKTVAAVTKVQFDTGLSDSWFTERQLQRAP